MPCLFALSDPHLSGVSPKPMDKFGPLWIDHAERIAENWRRDVSGEDIVLVPGDISWAMRLEEAREDLEWLDRLPGRKVLLRGNHDYWWQALSKIRALGLPTLHFVQNNHVELDGIAIGGSRLWDFPGIKWPFRGGAENCGIEADGVKKRDGDPEKIRRREVERLKLSLGGLPRTAGTRIAMTHFPPLGENGLPTSLTDIIASFKIDICVYGHIHNQAGEPRLGEDHVVGGTRFVLASTDHLGHRPKPLLQFQRPA